MLLQQQQPNFNTNNTLIFSLPFFPQKNITNNITLISKIQNFQNHYCYNNNGRPLGRPFLSIIINTLD